MTISHFQTEECINRLILRHLAYPRHPVDSISTFYWDPNFEIDFCRWWLIVAVCWGRSSINPQLHDPHKPKRAKQCERQTWLQTIIWKDANASARWHPDRFKVTRVISDPQDRWSLSSLCLYVHSAMVAMVKVTSVTTWCYYEWRNR